MKKTVSIICFLLSYLLSIAQDIPSVYVDHKGIFRWEDTDKEASFFGTNYTLPFAHAYRAVGYLDADRKAAIDEDVYHFARLGFNAYRIHIWDVEITDSVGNLIENEHLDLLDYLISKLKERHIYVLLTAQTDFGNGYPEKDQPTGGFSYQYEKCNVHSDPQAIMAQRKYLTSLVQHVNPYTGVAYADDPIVVGFEINNEPCHDKSSTQTRDYINQMLKTLRKAGNRKPVFYNVSHNLQMTEAYYDTDIQGTTYQWYPTGLVSGHTRKGNFLPNVDKYAIPFSGVKGFDNKAKLIYEFDPADLLYSYMYPAVVRSFRSAGFQWITQFAYDPMVLAPYNTEYQTHYLNLAYTPQKAISMKIAAEAAQKLPLNKAYGTYPQDTVFGDFRVSYKQNLSELNSPEKFYYSNTTQSIPVNAKRLESIVGYGSSVMAKYDGMGAYFIDKLEDGVWRLEVMPDAVLVSDPFAKSSLQKEVVRIYWAAHKMQLNIPDLGSSFTIKGINDGNKYDEHITDGTIKTIMPGTYLLKTNNLKVSSTDKWQPEALWGRIQLKEFVAPKGRQDSAYTVCHTPNWCVESGKALLIKAMVAGAIKPDSVLIYTDRVSFWNEHNTYYKMKNVGAFKYEARISPEDININDLKYNIVVFFGNKVQTFPEGTYTHPLDWDYIGQQYYETFVVKSESPVTLFTAKDNWSNAEVYTIPAYIPVKREFCHSNTRKDELSFKFYPSTDTSKFYVRKYIKEDVAMRHQRMGKGEYLCMYASKIPANLKIGFVTSDGITYSAYCSVPDNSVIRIPISSLKQCETALFPTAFPVFMEKYFYPQSEVAFDINKIETLEFSFEGGNMDEYELSIGEVWIE